MLRKLSPALSGAALCGLCFAQGSISDANASFTQATVATATSSAGGLVNFTASATTDIAYQVWWYYRIDADPCESAFNSSGGQLLQSYDGNRATLLWPNADGRGIEAHYDITTYSNGSAAGVAAHTMRVTNLTTQPITLNLFGYVDIDFCTSGGGDSAVGNPNGFTQLVTDPACATESGEVMALGADAYQVGAFGTLRNLLLDGSVTNLTNSGLPFGPGDYTSAFQWRDRVVHPGQTLVASLIQVHNRPSSEYDRNWFWKGANRRPMYDFDQKQDRWGADCGQPPQFVFSWCGPVALANSICWYDEHFARGLVPPALRDANGRTDPVALIQAIAARWQAQFGRSIGWDGVTCDELQRVAAFWVGNNKPGMFEVHAVPANDFDRICRELRRSQDVVVLMGFYRRNEQGQIVREGGHFVTLSGCGLFNGRPALAFSDPMWDSHAVGATPGRSNGPHGDPRRAPNDPANHNNPANYSHDVFTIVPDAGGCLGVQGYYGHIQAPLDRQNTGPAWNVTRPGAYIDWVFAVSPRGGGQPGVLTPVTTPRPGTTFVLEYESAPGTLYGTVLALPPFSTTPIPGINGTLLLTPPLFGLYSSAVPPSGIDAFGVPLPPNPGLSGFTFALQTLDVSPSAVASLVNAVGVVIE